MSIVAIDLNLLFVLHTVLLERNVARAAAQLRVTPSAVSNALARLRDTLGDPLVTRKGRGIVPTPRAMELAPVIARALGELEHAVASPFEPATCTRTFSLAIADAGQITSVPGIAAALGRAMPKAQLRVLGIDSLVALGDLGSSEIDLHVGVRSRAPGLHSEPLLREPLVLVGRRTRPRLTKAALATLAHVAVDMVPGRGFRDPVAAAYARAGIPRVVAVTVPSFTAAAAVVGATEHVATLPASLVATYGKRLRRLEGAAPSQTVDLAMSWHERTHHDPANVTFRALVREVIVR